MAVLGRRWQSNVETVKAALIELAPLGDVLELAGGTGNWTAVLAALANSVTVVDASPEAVEIARSKVKDKVLKDRVTWLHADIFNFQPSLAFEPIWKTESVVASTPVSTPHQKGGS